MTSLLRGLAVLAAAFLLAVGQVLLALDILTPPDEET